MAIRFASLFAAAALAAITGCNQSPQGNPPPPDNPPPQDHLSRQALPQTEILAEGVLYSVEYELRDGRTSGLTRDPRPEAVPGGNGNSGVNAYAQLTRDYLFITFTGRNSVTQVIPSRRLHEVRFGTGGVEPDEQGHHATGH